MLETYDLPLRFSSRTVKEVRTDRRLWLTVACLVFFGAPISSACAEGPAVSAESQLQLARAQRRKGSSGRIFYRLQWLTLSSVAGGTVMIQESKSQCRVHVLNGTAIVRSDLDRSILKVSAGGIYESTRKLGGTVQARTARDLATSQPPTPVFETSMSRTQILSMDEKSSPQAEIISPPTIVNYDIGETTLQRMPIPPHLVAHFPPSGIIPERGSGEAIASQRNANQ